MNFWTSELGQLSGKAEDAFTRTFTIIPNNTTAIAKIENFVLENDIYQISWKITDGEFKGRVVFQKIRAFDIDPNKRHKALNMMMYLYNLYQLKPKNSEAPQNNDLTVFVGKYAGIKIQETEPNENGKQYNWISEVHSASGFKSETGIRTAVESAFSRNQPLDVIDDLPFL